MDKTIKFRVKKQLNHSTEFKILRLKGALITENFTEIIYITDENEDYYLHSFSINSLKAIKVEEYLLDYILKHDLSENISLVKALS